MPETLHHAHATIDIAHRGSVAIEVTSTNYGLASDVAAAIDHQGDLLANVIDLRQGIQAQEQAERDRQFATVAGMQQVIRALGEQVRALAVERDGLQGQLANTRGTIEAQDHQIKAVMAARDEYRGKLQKALDDQRNEFACVEIWKCHARTIQAEADRQRATIAELHRTCDQLGGRAFAYPLPAAVAAELQRARERFPTWPTDALHALAVLGEEFGELTKAVLQGVYEPHKNGPDAVRREAVQTAAMALRFLESVSVYQTPPCPQHRITPAAA